MALFSVFIWVRQKLNEGLPIKMQVGDTTASMFFMIFFMGTNIQSVLLFCDDRIQKNSAVLSSLN